MENKTNTRMTDRPHTAMPVVYHCTTDLLYCGIPQFFPTAEILTLKVEEIFFAGFSKKKQYPTKTKKQISTKNIKVNVSKSCDNREISLQKMIKVCDIWTQKVGKCEPFFVDTLSSLFVPTNYLLFY